MPQKRYKTVKDVLDDIPGFIEDKLAHMPTTIVQCEEEKAVVYPVREEMVDKIIAILDRLALTNTAAGEVTGVGRGYFYYVKQRMYGYISTEKTILVLKYLEAFEKDCESKPVDTCIVHHRFLRTCEQYDAKEHEIKKAAFVEINILLRTLKLSPKSMGKVNEGYRGSTEMVYYNRYSGVSLRRTLELLDKLRTLSKEGYVSMQALKLSIEEREKLFKRILTVMSEKNLTPILICDLGICHKRNIYYIQARSYGKISLRKAVSILEKLENFETDMATA